MNIKWDPHKAQANVQSHGVTFTDAATVLTDDFALSREDPDAIGEQRFVTLGMSATGHRRHPAPTARAGNNALSRWG